MNTGPSRRRECAVYRANVLDRDEIGRIRSFARNLPSRQGTIHHNQVDLSIRHSIVRWLDPAEQGELAWLFDRVDGAMKDLNDLYFRLDVAWERPIRLQFTEYPPGCFYGSHADMHMEADSAHERKLSCSILLSEPAEHQGGDLIVNNKRLTPGKQSAPGTLIAFPSYVSHEVTPVTAGTRYSLVAWYMGPLWR